MNVQMLTIFSTPDKYVSSSPLVLEYPTFSLPKEEGDGFDAGGDGDEFMGFDGAADDQSPNPQSRKLSRLSSGNEDTVKETGSVVTSTKKSDEEQKISASRKDVFDLPRKFTRDEEIHSRLNLKSGAKRFGEMKVEGEVGGNGDEDVVMGEVTGRETMGKGVEVEITEIMEMSP